MRKTKWKIGERKNTPKKSNARFLLSGTPPGGKRVREFFPSRAAAEGRRMEIEADISRAGVLSVELSADERRQIAQLKKTLATYGKTITDAVNFYAAHLESRRKESTVTVQTALDLMLDVKANRELSRRYLDDLRQKCRRFAAKFGNRTCASVKADEVRKWLSSLKLSPVSFNDYKRIVGVLFSFAVNEKYCTDNPAAKVEAIKEVQHAPATIRADALPAILRHVRTAAPNMLPAFVIQAFAGLRTAEVCRLTWEDVRIEGGVIEVNALSAKNSVRRPVHIEKNLLAWLVSLRQPSGPIAPKDYLRRLTTLAAAMKTQGVTISHNALRHSFGTYHCARYDSTHATADQMGNSP
ncbi:MAG: tyrosine-type recombinase/integrase, partial [Puniceicoccales bacterium]|nr:tyrosine-type recombinase/integrase [Puniceicoccales bacterium]